MVKRKRLPTKRKKPDRGRLVHVISGKNYVLMNAPFTSTAELNTKLKELAKKGIIYRGIKQVERGGLLTSGLAVVDFFVPEKLVPKFSEMI